MLRSVFVDGNKEIVKVRDYTATSEGIIQKGRSNGRSDSITADDGLTTFFTYRFINYEWKVWSSEFVPIKFNCELPYDELRRVYTSEKRVSDDALRELSMLRFGSCDIRVPKASVFKIAISEILNPFYIF